MKKQNLEISEGTLQREEINNAQNLRQRVKIKGRRGLKRHTNMWGDKEGPSKEEEMEEY